MHYVIPILIKYFKLTDWLFLKCKNENKFINEPNDKTRVFVLFILFLCKES